MENVSWLNDVRNGAFDRVPCPLTWDGGGRSLAMLINCYKLSSTSELSEDFMRAERDYYRTGVWTGDVLRFWKLLFFAARAERFTIGFFEEDDDRYTAAMDALSEQLRLALMASTPSERKQLLNLMSESSST